MRELINDLFARHLANPYLDTDTDAVYCHGTPRTVSWCSPRQLHRAAIEFPGGNIGSLAVHGTTTTLPVAGAVPKYLSLGVLLEEGSNRGARARRGWHRRSAREIGVVVAAGDTKVVRRGEGGGIYLNTSASREGSAA